MGAGRTSSAYASSSKAVQYHQYAAPTTRINLRPSTNPPISISSAASSISLSRSIGGVDSPPKSPPIKRQKRPGRGHKLEVYIDNLHIFQADPEWARVKRRFLALKELTARQIRALPRKGVQGELGKGKAKAASPEYIQISSDDANEEAQVDRVLNLESISGGSSAPISALRSRSTSSTLVPLHHNHNGTDKGKKRMRSYSSDSDFEHLPRKLQSQPKSSRKRVVSSSSCTEEDILQTSNKLRSPTEKRRRWAGDDEYVSSDVARRPIPLPKPEPKPTPNSISSLARVKARLLTSEELEQSKPTPETSVIEDSEMGGHKERMSDIGDQGNNGGSRGHKKMTEEASMSFDDSHTTTSDDDSVRTAGLAVLDTPQTKRTCTESWESRPTQSEAPRSNTQDHHCSTTKQPLRKSPSTYTDSGKELLSHPPRPTKTKMEPTPSLRIRIGAAERASITSSSVASNFSPSEDEETFVAPPRTKRIEQPPLPKSVLKKGGCDEKRGDARASEPFLRCKVIVKQPTKEDTETDGESGKSNSSQFDDEQENQQASSSTAEYLKSSKKQETRAPPQRGVHRVHVLKRPVMGISDEVYKVAERKGTVAKKHCHMCRSRRWSLLCTGVIQRANKVERCTKGICDRCLAKFPLPFDPFDSEFKCPPCNGICFCDVCSHKRSSNSTFLSEGMVQRKSTTLSGEGIDACPPKPHQRATGVHDVGPLMSDGESWHHPRTSQMRFSSPLSPLGYPATGVHANGPDDYPVDHPLPSTYFATEEDRVRHGDLPNENEAADPIPRDPSPFRIDTELERLNNLHAAAASDYGLPDNLQLPSIGLGIDTAPSPSSTEVLECFPAHLWELPLPSTPSSDACTTSQTFTSPIDPTPSLSSPNSLTPYPSSEKPFTRALGLNPSSLVLPDVERAWSSRREHLLWASLERHTQLARSSEKHGYGFLSLDPKAAMQGYTWTGGAGMFAFEKYTEMSDPWPWPREGPGELKDKQILEISRSMAASLAQSREHVVSWDQLVIKRCQSSTEEGLALGPSVQTPHQSVYLPDNAGVIPLCEASQVPDDPVEEPTSPTEVDDLASSTSVGTVTAPLPDDPCCDEMADVAYKIVGSGPPMADFTPPPMQRRDTLLAAMATLRATGRLIPGLCN
ncbi:hypothetical protein FRB96_002263 [Tulasnella sp. 330]|nr:hypothetical protein FRB96_002263 [Tulasnella sp. 330]